MLKNNAGYDLKQLFIGTEGTLGIVTRAVLRLRPAMRSVCSAFLALDDFRSMPLLLKQLGSESGGTLSAFEVMLATLYAGGCIVIDRHFSAERCLERIQEEAITHTAMVPLQYQKLVECTSLSAYDLSSLDAYMTAGFLLACFLVVRWIFKSGYRLRT